MRCVVMFITAVCLTFLLKLKWSKNKSVYKGIVLQTLRGKQKYQATNVGVEKINLSRLLVQRINEFTMSEIQRKTPLSKI